jgi:predicted PurR-regulated permease PerM
MKQFFINTLVVLGTLLGLVLLWQFRAAVLLSLFSLVLASMLRPAVQWFVLRGLPRSVAIILVYLLGLGSLGGLIYLISAPLLQELQDLSDQLATAYEQIVVTWPYGTPFQQQLAEQLPQPANLYQAIAGERGTLFIQNILGFAQGFFGILAGFSIALILSIYWAIDRLRFERLWLSWLPVEKRVRARTIWREIENGAGAYMRSEIIQSLLVIVLLGLGYWVMGLPYPILLSLTGAIFWLFPWLGAVLTVLLPLIAGLNSGILVMVVACVYTIGVLLLLEFVIEPRIFDHRQFSSLNIVVFMVALAQSYGLVGMLIAPPLAAASQILLTNLLYTSAPAYHGLPQTRLSSLNEKLTQIQDSMAATDDIGPEYINLTDRLVELIDQANNYFNQRAEESNPDSLGLPVEK